MNDYFDDAALDRALFALELEEPPADLRAAILHSTAYRPAPMFSQAELIGLGVIVASILTMVGVIVAGGGALFVHSINLVDNLILRSLSNHATLLWLAAGGATAIWLSLFTGFQSNPAVASKVGESSVR